MIKLDVWKICTRSTTNADSRALFAVANLLVVVTVLMDGLQLGDEAYIIMPNSIAGDYSSAPAVMIEVQQLHSLKATIFSEYRRTAASACRID